MNVVDDNIHLGPHNTVGFPSAGDAAVNLNAAETSLISYADRSIMLPYVQLQRAGCNDWDSDHTRGLYGGTTNC